MEAEDDAQPRIAQILCDHAVNRTVALQPQQIREDPQHVREACEGDVSKLFESDAEDRFRLPLEALVALQVAGGKACDLRAHALRIAAVVEVRPVVEADAIEGLHRPERNVVGKPLAAEVPKLLEEKRRRDDGRAGVEDEAVLTKDTGATAQRIELLQHRHAVAARTEADGGREPAEAAADDDGVGPLVPLPS